VSLAGFVTAFGGDVTLVDMPKTLTGVNSDDEDDDAWQKAKPLPVNDVVDE
jgi:hypothetical protein